MRRAALLAVVVSVLLGTFAGVAWATDIFCTGGRCEGTQVPDNITGTDQIDLIFARGGFDEVQALAGADELHGNNGDDFLIGGDTSDTYFGGDGSDFLGEEGSTGRDVMNGGADSDTIDANVGRDILRGQDGDECEDTFEVAMFGGQNKDKLYGGPGEDCMEGNEGADEHYGGPDNDFINAVDDDADPDTDTALGTHDLVDCGDGVDTAVVRLEEDIVRDNCENIIDVSPARVAPSAGTTDEEEQQQKEAFLQEHGLQQ